MLNLRNAWQKSEDFDLEIFTEEWADRLIGQLCLRTGENPEIYETDPEDRGDFSFTINPHKDLKDSAALEEFKLIIQPDEMSVEIAELRINQKGKGLGKLIALDTILGFKKIGYKNFELDAQNMGSDFWPQLGFAPQATRDLEDKYRQRFELLKPYLPSLRAAMISREFKNFNSFSPHAFAKMIDAETACALCDNPEFRKTFAVFGSHEEIAQLTKGQEVLHYIIENMIDDSQYKIGTLLNSRISENELWMTLNWEDDEARDIFQKCHQKFLRDSLRYSSENRYEL